MWYEQFAGHTGNLETIIGNIWVPVGIVFTGFLVWDVAIPLVNYAIRKVRK